ncbi:MAG: hypothetical protein RLZZ628_3343 [Bacteroidota bacterium]|jgi:hypothetical protein
MKKLYIAFSFGLIINQLAAQSGALGYGSQSFISSNSSNPAVGGSDVQFVLGLPTNVNLDVTNSFKLSDMLTKTATNTVLNLNSFANNLSASNHFGMNLSMDLLHIGFHVAGMYVSVGSQFFSNTQASFSNSAIKLLAEGNVSNPNVALTGESIYHQSFAANYIGASRSFLDDKLSVGVRLKQLMGVGDLETKKLNYTVKTDATSNPMYALQIKSDIEIQGGGIFATVLDAMGDSAKRAKLATDVTANPLTGSGFGVDLGATYKINDKITVSASAINLGSISWKQENAVTAKGTGNGTFDWAGYNYKIGGTNAKLNTDSITTLAKNALVPGTTHTAYSSSLPTAFYLGASYQLTSKQQVAAMYRTQTTGQVTNTLLGLNYRLQVLKSLQLSAGVSLPSNASMTVGGGLVWSPGPVQLYLMTDNIATNVDNTNRIHLQAGLNIVLRKKKDAVVPIPSTPEPPKAVKKK